MKTDLVMTIIGADKPGLVESLASRVVQFGGNWLESRMCRLGGQFAGIVRVQIPQENESNLRAALKECEGESLAVTIKSEPVSTRETSDALVSLEIIGQDRPGIVQQVTHALALHHVNVEEFFSECESAPMSGGTLFKAKATLLIPQTCRIDQLRKDLEKIAADLMIDLQFGSPV